MDSRRINNEYKFIYRIENNNIDIISCKGTL
ncbi:MAG: type II toxin-antitoxin system YoeB family toxin [Peptoniphilus harei]|nr:type II toxin-antitoxin system YoeB family toxin [Peptoniphilus harei]